MSKQFFVIGIGGTGMRCLESLIHLCAIGMFDNTIIHMLAIDTDTTNGNFTRMRHLKDAYCAVQNGADPTSDTFFSAQLKYYEYNTPYNGNKNNFKRIFSYTENTPEGDLADLVFTKDVEEFSLTEGYRARTHLGSMMMYNDIIKAARKKNTKTGLYQFLNAISNNSSGTEKSRVFILGSVFGGTGASSIPVIPQALQQAAKMAGFKTDPLENCYFGATLLTAYFNFTPPKDNVNKIVADSQKFALNSKIAMMYYNEDPDVKRTYQRFYMLGTQTPDFKVDESNASDKTVAKSSVGGSSQLNDSHYIELMAACAARDFYLTDEKELKDEKENWSEKGPSYLYRVVDPKDGKFSLTFSDFVGNQNNADINFAFKFGSLLVYSIIANEKGKELVKAIEEGRQTKMFEDLKGEYAGQVEGLKDYFALFHFDNRSTDVFKDGWVRQMAKHTDGGRFLFNKEFFDQNNITAMNAYDWNKKLFDNDMSEKHRFKYLALNDDSGNYKFDKIRELANKIYQKGGDSSADKMARISKIIYQALKELYKFDK